MDFKVNLKEIKSDYDITLHKMNKHILGQISNKYVESLSKTIDGTDEIRFSVPRYLTSRIGFYTIENPLYREIKNERLVCLNNKEYYVIKDISEDDYKNKEVVAYSMEIKLGKIDINIEDVGLQMYTTDIENGIFSLNDYMKEQTGWSLGHVDDIIAYDIKEDGTKTEKLRWQESINSNWHDFLITNIKEQFECIVTFDTYNKLVNLYHIDSFGDNIQLYLSHDNYIKSVGSTDDSQDIVTRMRLVGNEEMDIIGATVTGYDYIDDYSYFIENEEMSGELIFALQEYEKMIKIREPIWKELINKKGETNSNLIRTKTDLYTLYAEIKALNSMKDVYQLENDTENYAKTVAELTKKKDEQIILEQKVEALETELQALNDSINNINILCKRETCTNENGELIFNETLLEELKEFLYYDTYSNDAFLKVEDLISSGKRELSLRCKPATEWKIDVVNFLGRIIDNGFRKHWNGELALGDIIVLYNNIDKKEELIYFVGYNQNLKEGSLDITLSNKKTAVDNSKVIADYLNKAEKAIRVLSMKRYLFIQQKYNRINLDYKKYGGA